MITVGTFEAKNRLSELLDKVEQGEEVVITRHGRPVARLVSPDEKHGRAEARAAFERLVALGREVAARHRDDPITVQEILSWRDEGRR